MPQRIPVRPAYYPWNKGAGERVVGRVPALAAPFGRASCEGALESNDPKPAALARRKVPTFAAALDDEVTE